MPLYTVSIRVPPGVDRWVPASWHFEVDSTDPAVIHKAARDLCSRENVVMGKIVANVNGREVKETP